MQYPTGKSGGFTIPSDTLSLGDHAFFYCTGLTSVTIPASITSVGTPAFYGCSNLTDISVAAGNLAYASQDGVLYSKDIKTLIRCPGGKTGVVIIPGSVTGIGGYAFSTCYNLINVIIPAGLTSMGAYAFYFCTNLINIRIPASVASLGDSAFEKCSSLAGAFFYGNAPTMGYCAFNNCASGFTVYYTAGATGFTNPWHGYPTALFDPSAPTTSVTTTAPSTTTTALSSTTSISSATTTVGGSTTTILGGSTTTISGGSTTTTTTGDACSFWLFPQQIHKVHGIIAPIKLFIIIAEEGTVFSGIEELSWGAKSVQTLLALSIGERIVFGFILVDSAALVPGNLLVSAGDCEATMEVLSF